jgi:hypothetical protein
MPVLTRHIDAIYKDNHDFAWLGSQMVEALQRDVAPERLQAVQDVIRNGLRSTREWLTEMKSRRPREEGLVARGVTDRATQGALRAELTRRLKLKRTLLRERRSLFQQFGDACAWIVLRWDRRLLAALFDPSRTHDLPTGIGEMGPERLIRRAHARGPHDFPRRARPVCRPV